MTKTILVVAAHPDDEVLGCGGVIAKHVAAEDEVHLVFMADGVGARSSELDSEKRAREAAMYSASRILGVSSTICLGFPDNRMDGLELLDIVQPLEDILRKLRPELVYTHHYGDLNIDHQLTHQAVMTACRPQPSFYVREILTFEVVSSTEWQSPTAMPFLPNVFVDISPYLDKKFEALKAYDMEIREEPHARSLGGVKALASFRGASVGVDAAEAFMMVRSLK